MRKSVVYLLPVLILWHSVIMGNAQNSVKKGMDIGPFVGIAYYLGELNPSGQYRSSHASTGLNARFPLNNRYALRASLITTGLSPSGQYPAFTGNKEKIVNTNLIELSGLFELNYLRYVEGSDVNYYTPYITAGISLFYGFGMKKPLQAALPFGIGFKYNLSKNLNLSVEWIFRRTFTDGLDNMAGIKPEELQSKQTAYYYNKDWFAMAGLTLTYKISFGKLPCWGGY